MLTPAAHLTCVGATRAEVDAVIAAYARGRRAPHRGAARRSAGRRRRALRAASRRLPQCRRSRRRHQTHLPILKFRSRPIRKSIPTAPRSPPTSTCSRPRSMPARARAITQFFFENDLYFRYLDRVRAAGIDIPIVPGILPVQNFKTRQEISPRAAGASVPDWLADALRRPRRRSGDAQADRRRRRRRAGARSRRPRRHRFPFLHDEPRRSGLRDLPPARLAAEHSDDGARKRRPKHERAL